MNQSKTPTTPPSFAMGVRIFFAGSWIFCADRTGKRMLAISRNMTTKPNQMNHIFPYGVWTAAGIDNNGTSLLPNNLAPKQPAAALKPYLVDVAGFAPSAGTPTMEALFRSTIGAAPFTYLQNKDGDIGIDLTRDDLRIISVPRPASITPAAFRNTATLFEKTVGIPRAKQSKYPGDKGVATTHIFDYPGAASLTFPSPTGVITIQAATDSSADLHFHVLPSPRMSMDHGPAMFGNMMQIVTSKSGSFVPTNLVLRPGTSPNDVRRGDLVPASVTDAELEISPPHPKMNQPDPAMPRMFFDMASCGGGSCAIDGTVL